MIEETVIDDINIDATEEVCKGTLADIEDQNLTPPGYLKVYTLKQLKRKKKMLLKTE